MRNLTNTSVTIIVAFMFPFRKGTTLIASLTKQGMHYKDETG